MASGFIKKINPFHMVKMSESALNRTPDCCSILPKLESTENHTVMFLPQFDPERAPPPFPSTYEDKWDFDHVRMPCSPQNKFPAKDSNGESKWNLICRSLRRSIKTSQELEEAIMEYNSEYKNIWNFHCLHDYINKYMSEEERIHFFEVLLPAMINITLDLPNICTQPPPLLKKNKDHFLSMSQKQVGCLLLNAFFCTFPFRNKDYEQSEYHFYPTINFNGFFSGEKRIIFPLYAEKFKCFFNYFNRITSKEPVGTVTFHRQFINDSPVWSESDKRLTTVVVKSEGLIETCDGLLQVDFADKMIGGYVFDFGFIQEEIRFLICPELIVSRLFSEFLEPKEAIIFTGAERYNSHSGYSLSFKYEGDFQHKTLRDAWGRKYIQLVAIDAYPFQMPHDQYQPVLIERELNKAFCGFYEDADPANLSAVATGNWGCGAFHGDPIFKFVIQLMAASQASRSLLYFTFNDKTLKEQLQDIYNLCRKKKLTVSDLWNILVKIEDDFHKILPSSIFQLIFLMIKKYTVAA